jgi:hypothetical protein
MRICDGCNGNDKNCLSCPKDNDYDSEQTQPQLQPVSTELEELYKQCNRDSDRLPF